MSREIRERARESPWTTPTVTGSPQGVILNKLLCNQLREKQCSKDRGGADPGYSCSKKGWKVKRDPPGRLQAYEGEIRCVKKKLLELLRGHD
jgi:hypothetical protein